MRVSDDNGYGLPEGSVTPPEIDRCHLVKKALLVQSVTSDDDDECACSAFPPSIFTLA